MRMLLLGGTVFLSKAVAVEASDRDHEVTAAARGASGSPPDSVRFVRVDRDSAAGMAPLAGEAFDAVIDVARVPGHVGHALDVLADGAGHWTFVSTISVYADRSTPGQTVATGALLPPAPPDSLDAGLDRYGASKVACENLVRDRVGDRCFTLRAGLIVGPGDPIDRFGYWPHRIAAGGEVLAPGEPGESVQYIDVRDLASWIVDAAEARTTGVYDGARPPMPRSQFLAEIAAALDADASFTWVPQEFLLDHGVRPWAGEDSLGLWVPLPDYAGMLSRDTAPSLTAGMRVRPLADTARAWYQARTEPPRLDAGLSREKEAEVLAAWHAGS